VHQGMKIYNYNTGIVNTIVFPVLMKHKGVAPIRKKIPVPAVALQAAKTLNFGQDHLVIRVKT
jgi:hypothetical protein